MTKSQAILLTRELFRKNNLVFLDTETTGVESDSKIVDLGVIGSDGRILIDILINPEIPMPEGATKVNHITDDMLTKAPRFKDIHMTVANILKGRTIVAWNSNFDKRMVENSYKSLGLEPPKCTWIDAMPIYGGYANKSGRVKLCIASQECGIVEEQEHRAVGDCIFTLKVLRTIIK